MKRPKLSGKFVICIRNEDCDDLEPRKLYRVLRDEAAAVDGYIRVIDESGEDYLYPQDYFLPIELPKARESSVIRCVEFPVRGLNNRSHGWRLT